MTANYTTISVEDTKVAMISLDPRDPQKPYIVYHHGLFGSMEGVHCQDALKISEETGCGFLTFDNLAHGKTATLDGSVPLEKCNMENWVSTSTAVIRDQLPEHAHIILVGNSFGAGVLYLTALEMTQNIESFLGIGAAPDVISEEIAVGLQQYFDHGVLNSDQQADYEAGNVIYAPFPDPQGDMIPISKTFIEVADTHKVLGNEKVLSCPAVLFQGSEDNALAADKAIRFLDQFGFVEKQFKRVVGGQHDLATEGDRKLISAALQTMILGL